MIFTVFSLLLTLYVVSSVISSLNSQKRTYTKDLDNFVIQGSPKGRIILSICIVVMLGFAVLAYLNRTPDNGAEDAAIIFLLLASGCAVGGLALDKQITIKENNIQLRQLLPPKFKSYTFSDITHYAMAGDAVQVFSGQNKLFSADKDLLGYENLVKRLKRDGFRMSNDGVTPAIIRKKDIIMKNGTVTGLGVFFLFIGLIFGILFARNPAQGETATGNFIIGILVAIGLYLVIAAFLVIPSLKNIRTVEKSLGINFNDEMKKEGIGSFDAITPNWFLNSAGGVITAIRRDWIQSIISCTLSENGAFYVYELQTRDGKIIKARADNNGDLEDRLRGM